MKTDMVCEIEINGGKIVEGRLLQFYYFLGVMSFWNEYKYIYLIYLIYATSAKRHFFKTIIILKEYTKPIFEHCPNQCNSLKSNLY